MNETGDLLIIQETKDMTSSYLMRVGTQEEAVVCNSPPHADLIKFFVMSQRRLDNPPNSMVFDLQELLQYYESVFDLRFLRKEPRADNQQDSLDMDMAKMEVVGRKALLEAVVNHCTLILERCMENITV